MSAVRSLQHTCPKTKKRWSLQAHPHTKTKSGSVIVTGMNDKKDKTEMRSVHSLSQDPQHKTLRVNSPKKQQKGAQQQHRKEKSISGQTMSTVLEATGKNEPPVKEIHKQSQKTRRM